MNLDLIFALIFYGLIILFFIKNREKFQVQAKIFALYRTKLGLKLMDKASKIFPRFLGCVGYLGIFVGFCGMLFIFYWLIRGTWQLLAMPGAPPAIAPVLPGVAVPGLPNLSFWHWIIAIFIVAVVHEFSHGLFARLYNVKIKSSGFALFGPVLAAFVEPEEKTLRKKSKKAQLSMLAAGPFSNIALGFIFLLIITFALAPVQNLMFQPDGIQVNKIVEGYPAEGLDLDVPFVIKKINEYDTLDVKSFVNATNVGPDEDVKLVTDKGTFTLKTVENPENSSKGFIGITDFESKIKVKEGFNTFLANTFLWFYLLVFWLFIVNLGVGLFNLLPLGPVDGGRLFYIAALGIFKNDKVKAGKLLGTVSLFCLMLILLNLLPYITKLVLFLLKPLMFLFSLL